LKKVAAVLATKPGARHTQNPKSRKDFLANQPTMIANIPLDYSLIIIEITSACD
jgi:hypothetical protein